MTFPSKFTFLMKGEHKKNNKSFKWIIREDKVLLKDEIKTLKKFSLSIKREGLKKRKFSLVRNWFMIELGLSTGLRVKEMANLQIKDLLIYNQHTSVFVRRGKGGKPRNIWISEEFKQTCFKFLKLRQKFHISNHEESFLMTKQNGKRLTKRALSIRSMLP